MDGYQWSAPFSVDTEGEMRIMLKNNTGDDQMQIRVAVRSGAKMSRFEVIFHPNTLSSPYRFLLSHIPWELSQCSFQFLFFNLDIGEDKKVESHSFSIFCEACGVILG